jgi:hypothetical protein
MVDGRLLAAYRSMYETAAVLAARQKQQEEGGADACSDSPAATVADLGTSWQQHLRLAVARRSRELLRGMPTPLLTDLQQLAAWEQESGQEQHGWAAAQRYYAAAVGAYEAAQPADWGAADSSSGSADGGLLDAGAAGDDVAWAQMLLQQGQQQQGGDWQEAPGGDLLPDSAGSAGSDAGTAPLLLDAGAVGADLELAQALLQGGRQQQEGSSGADGVVAQPGSSSSSGIQSLIYRCYKKQILWDAVLLPDASSVMC